MTDYRIGKRMQLHPATDRWMMGDRFGEIVAISKRVRHYIDPKDPRNGQIFTVVMDRSGKRIRVSEGHIDHIYCSL